MSFKRARHLYLGFGLTYLLLLLYLASYRLWPQVVGRIFACPLHRFLGVECPTCGLTRAYMLLFAGHPLEATGAHPLLLPTLLAAVVFPVICLIDYFGNRSLLPRIFRYFP